MVEERPCEGSVKARLGIELLLLQRPEGGQERVGHALELERVERGSDDANTEAGGMEVRTHLVVACSDLDGEECASLLVVREL